MATRNAGKSALKNGAGSKNAANAKTAGNARKAARKNKAARRERLSRGVRSSGNDIAVMRKGPGSGSAGQSGDIQGLSDVETADSESVRELVEDGQDYEAGIVDGVENAPDADQGEVKTREVPQDDVILDKIPGKRNTL
ncbi:MAG: response regulator [Candidatus Acidiferrales bacterium]